VGDTARRRASIAASVRAGSAAAPAVPPARRAARRVRVATRRAMPGAGAGASRCPKSGRARPDRRTTCRCSTEHEDSRSSPRARRLQRATGHAGASDPRQRWSAMFEVRCRSSASIPPSRSPTLAHSGAGLLPKTVFRGRFCVARVLASSRDAKIKRQSAERMVCTESGKSRGEDPTRHRIRILPLDTHFIKWAIFRHEMIME
jgi:hypothetical protein